MECKNCGKQLKDNANFCRYCGTPVNIKEEQDIEEKKEIESVKVSDTAELNENNDSAPISISGVQIDENKSEKIENNDNDDISKTSSIVTNTESSKKIKEILAEMTPYEIEKDISNDDNSNNVENNDTEEKSNEGIDEPTLKIPEELIRKYSKNGSLPKKIEEEKTTEIITEDVSKEDIVEEVSSDEINLDEANKPEQSSEKVEVVEQDKKEEYTDTLVKNKEEYNTMNEKENNIDTSLESPSEKIVLDVKDEHGSVESLQKEESKVEKVIEEKEIKKETKSNILPESLKEDLEKEKLNLEEIVQEEEITEEQNIPKKRHGGIITLIIVLIISLSAIGYLLYSLYNSKDELTKADSEKEQLQAEIEKLKTVSTNATDTTDVITFNGYQIRLLDNKNFSLSNNSLIMKTDDSTISTKINTETKYTTIKYSKDTYKNLLTNAGYTVKSYGTKVVDAKEYVVYEVTDSNNKNYLVAYTMLEDSNVIAFIISNNENSINYDVLEETNKIVSSAKADNTSDSNNLNIFIKDTNE